MTLEALHCFCMREKFATNSAGTLMAVLLQLQRKTEELQEALQEAEIQLSQVKEEKTQIQKW